MSLFHLFDILMFDPWFVSLCLSPLSVEKVIETVYTEKYDFMEGLHTTCGVFSDISHADIHMMVRQSMMIVIHLQKKQQKQQKQQHQPHDEVSSPPLQEPAIPVNAIELSGIGFIEKSATGPHLRIVTRDFDMVY